MKNGFELTKKKQKVPHKKQLLDTDYADDIAILANTLAQAKNPTA